MWIYILVGVICNLIGALTMWFMMKPLATAYSISEATLRD